ncbi:MAG: hypothetical protein OCD02_11275 [Spirochaetaceae bacterium]
MKLIKNRNRSSQIIHDFILWYYNQIDSNSDTHKPSQSDDFYPPRNMRRILIDIFDVKDWNYIRTWFDSKIIPVGKLRDNVMRFKVGVEKYGYNINELGERPISGNNLSELQRKEIVSLLFKKFNKYHILFLQGIGGWGKTTLAGLIYYGKKEYFVHRIYVDIQGTDILTTLSQYLSRFSSYRLETTTDILDFLNSRTPGPNLLIIDNISSNSKFPPDIIMGLNRDVWKVILTSRQWFGNVPNNNVYYYSIESISKLEARQLFYSNALEYHKVLNNEYYLDLLINKLGSHPKLISYYSKTIEEYYITTGNDLLKTIIDDSFATLPSLPPSFSLENDGYTTIHDLVMHITQISSNIDILNNGYIILVIILFTTGGNIKYEILKCIKKHTNLLVNIDEVIHSLIRIGILKQNTLGDNAEYNCHNIFLSAFDNTFFNDKKRIFLDYLRISNDINYESLTQWIKSEIYLLNHNYIMYFIEYYKDIINKELISNPDLVDKIIYIIENSTAAYDSFSNIEPIIMKFEFAVGLTEKYDYITYQILFLYELGAVYGAAKNYEVSLKYKKIGYKLVLKHMKDSDPLKASYISRYAYTIGLLKGHEAALKLKKDAYRILNKVNKNKRNDQYYRVSMNISDNIGGSLGSLAKYSEAELYKTKALNSAIISNDLFSIARYHNNLGYHYVEIGKLELAEKHIKKSLIIYNELKRNNDRYYLMPLQSLCRIQIWKNNFRDAKSILNNIEEIYNSREYLIGESMIDTEYYQLKGEYSLFKSLSDNDQKEMKKAFTIFNNKEVYYSSDKRSKKYLTAISWLYVTKSYMNCIEFSNEYYNSIEDIFYHHYECRKTFSRFLFTLAFARSLLLIKSENKIIEILTQQLKSFINEFSSSDFPFIDEINDILNENYFE